MRRILFLAVLVGLCHSSALADHIFTSAKWNGWAVSTGEEVWFKHRHTSYPIWQMFDGDPRTAWVYSGGFTTYKLKYDANGQPIEPTQVLPLRDRYWIQLTPDKPRQIDEIRFMNGYNKDAKTFLRNARITKVEVFATDGYGPYSVEKKPLGSFNVTDSMGWHTIKLPERTYKGLWMVVTDIRRGSDPDVAISELQVLQKGEDVGPGKPDYAIYNEGSECGDGGCDALVDFQGNVLATGENECEGIQKSPDGRYFEGATYRQSDDSVLFWVFDKKGRQKVWSRRYPGLKSPSVSFDSNDRLIGGRYVPKKGKWSKQVFWTPSDGASKVLPVPHP